MKSLLAADFYRMWKSKTTYIALIIAIVLPLILNALYLALLVISKSLDQASFDALGFIINGRTIISLSYNVGNNMALITPMFVSIFLCTDITSGMLRNKIVAGKQRSKIFVSYLITSAFLSVVIITLYASLMSLFGILFFGYGIEFTGTEAVNLTYYFISGTVAFLFLATVSLFFALTTSNSALCIVFTLLFSFVLGIIITIVSLLDIENIEYVLCAIPTYTSTMFDNGLDDTPYFIEGLISMITFGVLNVFLAYTLFKKKELK